jgi:hypothetical protein
MRLRKNTTKLAVSAVLAALAVAPTTNASEEKTPLTQLAMSAVPAATSGSTSSLANSMANYGLNWLKNGLGESAPEWAKRIELELGLLEDEEPTWSILTVQPLYQTDSKDKTLFVQARLAKNYQFGDDRITANGGLGYRQLFVDNTLLLGANTFYDYESEMDHTRVGVGAEARWYNFDFYANYYDATSDTRTYTDATGSGTEKALDGFDLELTSQVPYLPWLRVRGKYFEYDSDKATDDVDGWSYSAEMDLHPNMRFEIGSTDDNFSDNAVFAKFTFQLASAARPAATKQFVADKAFELRDMTTHTLDKVRRNNTIRVERVTNGNITISRQ